MPPLALHIGCCPRRLSPHHTWLRAGTVTSGSSTSALRPPSGRVRFEPALPGRWERRSAASRCPNAHCCGFGFGSGAHTLQIFGAAVGSTAPAAAPPAAACRLCSWCLDNHSCRLTSNRPRPPRRQLHWNACLFDQWLANPTHVSAALIVAHPIESVFAMPHSQPAFPQWHFSTRS